MKVKDILGEGSVWMPGVSYMKEKPLVSILLPTFRRAKSGYFERAVYSVLQQTLKNIELIIVDDCSTDGTFDLIQNFMKLDERISCIRHMYNVGLPAISEYEAYIKARGDYIAFIFDDDEWDFHFLYKTYFYMLKNHIQASYGFIYAYSSVSEFIILGNSDETDLLYGFNYIGNMSVVLHRDVIETVGLYDPHLSLTRLCDWDLWIRVIKLYKFEGTNIYAGNEYGISLNDSLGNTVTMNLWFSREQIFRDRNLELRPTAFPEYEIDKVYQDSSEFFSKSIIEIFKSYENRKWYTKQKANDISTCSKRKRMVIFANNMDACTTLYFVRLLNYTEYFSIYFCYGSLNLYELALTDVLIVIRDLVSAEPYLKKCDELNIPYYYFTDDNFVELVKKSDKKNEILSQELNRYKQISYNWNILYFSKFKGIIVSSDTLKEFMDNNNYHKNIIMLKPFIDKQLLSINKLSIRKKVNIAFMGGKFRSKLFKDIVLPAIIDLSSEFEINLYYPFDDDLKEIKTLKVNNLCFFEMKRILSLNKVIQVYGEKNIDIQIHPGVENENNIYKTENALINAVTLGAVLVASLPPYQDKSKKDKIYFTADNTVKSWKEEIKSAICRQKEVFENANKYCMNMYSEANAIPISRELYNDEESSMITSILRYDTLYIDLLNHKQYDVNTSKSPRSLLETKLYLSRLIKNKIKYKIQSDVDNLAQIGFTMSSFGQSKGSVDILLIYKWKVIRDGSIRLEEIDKDNWNYISFEPIKNSKNKKYLIVFKLNYEKESALAGVFEDVRNRGFFYKVFNKIGIHLKGKNTIFVDCRSEEDKI